MRAIAVVCLLLAGPGLAAADGTGGTDEARPARDGFAIGLALGPGIIADVGFGDAGGVGGHASLRVGTSAMPNMLWILQLDTYAYRRTVAGQDEKGEQAVNTLALAAQYYLTGAMWAKAGGGLAGVVTRDGAGAKNASSGGLALLGAGGIDVLRSGPFVVDLEANVALSLFGDGALITVGLGLGINWY